MNVLAFILFVQGESFSLLYIKFNYPGKETADMYEKVSTDLNFVAREKNIGKFWRNQQIFEKSMKAREGCPVYTFYDGPPTANGKPHIGHVLTRVIKDMIPRYKTMKGYMVPRKAGWDTDRKSVV